MSLQLYAINNVNPQQSFSTNAFGKIFNNFVMSSTTWQALLVLSVRGFIYREYKNNAKFKSQKKLLKKEIDSLNNVKITDCTQTI